MTERDASGVAISAAGKVPPFGYGAGDHRREGGSDGMRQMAGASEHRIVRRGGHLDDLAAGRLPERPDGGESVGVCFAGGSYHASCALVEIGAGSIDAVAIGARDRMRPDKPAAEERFTLGDDISFHAAGVGNCGPRRETIDNALREI